ncbi:MAG: hypothetical protein JWP36_1437 [Paucimonas sp.]|nr:hypothetical protein [Paucimonas sp.]
MKKTMLFAAVFAAYAGSVSAQTAAPAAAAAPASPHTVTGNLTIATDYRFRGISQTFRLPAVQGGFDYSHSSGLYLGNWNSNVSGNLFQNGAGIEMDFYGGYKFDLAKDVQADIGLLYYYYPGAETPVTRSKYNNLEVYFGGTYKWLTAKYSYAITDFFGLNAGNSAALFSLPANGNSKGSGYLDLTGNWEIAEKTTLTAHIGRQTVKNYGAASYTDYKLGVAKDYGVATAGLALVGTNANAAQYTIANVPAGTSTKNIGRPTVVLSAAKTF